MTDQPGDMAQVAIDNANLLIAPAPRPAMVMIFVPALGVRANYYAAFARALNHHGITVVLNELRGHGQSPVTPNRCTDFGYSALINEDLRKAVTHVQAVFRDLPLVLAGHSLGGQLATLFAARYQPKVAGIIQIACGSPYFRGFPPARRRAIYWGSFAIQTVSALMGYFPGRFFGFGGREARRLMNDWSRVARTNLFNFKDDPYDYDGTLAAVGCPVLSFCFPADTYAPLPAVRYFTDKLPQNRVKLRLLNIPEFQDTDHFNWIAQGPLIAPLLAAWLSRATV
ncbi:MAG: alpha/beta fold hydrolase [Desulfobacteraceae bacterium]|nr:alpha/beta fold hydrolase [Desulfobacteraceae bacterium]MDD3991900.1 alpha/beta fold hydrolase [Desulfobacteraceae bacterium]